MSQRDLVDELAGLAEVARKSGPIGLEKVEIEDPFLAKGVRFVADGYDGNFISDNLERDRDNFLTHLDEGQKIYRAVGDCAPAFGMIGTLIGMVQMFANMTDPQPVMAVALRQPFTVPPLPTCGLPLAESFTLTVDEAVVRDCSLSPTDSEARSSEVRLQVQCVMSFGVQGRVRYSSGIIEVLGLPTRPRLKNAAHIDPSEASATPSPDEHDRQRAYGARFKGDRKFSLASASLRQAFRTCRRSLRPRNTLCSRKPRRVSISRLLIRTDARCSPMRPKSPLNTLAS